MLLQGKRIFVVEDNSENRVLLRMCLSKHGAALGFEINGSAVVTKLNEFSPVDLIILDLMLGRGSTGYKVADDIRTHAAYATVPIVAVSAANAAEAIPKCMEHGFDGFIAKPIDIQIFPQQLSKILQGEKIWSTGIIPGQN